MQGLLDSEIGVEENKALNPTMTVRITINCYSILLRFMSTFHNVERLPLDLDSLRCAQTAQSHSNLKGPFLELSLFLKGLEELRATPSLYII